MAVVVARLADTGGHRGFIFITIHHHRADVAAVEEIIIIIAHAPARAVFRIIAQAHFQLLPFHFRHRHFYRHPVALHIFKIGLHRCTGIMAVLLQRLLVIEQLVQIIRRAGGKLRQPARHAHRIALRAADVDIAEIHRPAALYRHAQIGRVLRRIDGGLAVGKRGERVFFAGHCREHGGFAAAPIALVKRIAHRQRPIIQSIFIIGRQIFVLQNIAQNRHAHIFNFGLRAGRHRHHIAFTRGRHGNAAVEIAFGAQHGLHVIRRVFGQKAYLLAIKHFLLLLGDQRQVFLQHGLDFAVVGADFHRIFQRQVAAFFLRLRGLIFSGSTAARGHIIGRLRLLEGRLIGKRLRTGKRQRGHHQGGGVFVHMNKKRQYGDGSAAGINSDSNIIFSALQKPSGRLNASAQIGGQVKLLRARRPIFSTKYPATA